jgi:hypothetical protein
MVIHTWIHKYPLTVSVENCTLTAVIQAEKKVGVKYLSARSLCLMGAMDLEA